MPARPRLDRRALYVSRCPGTRGVFPAGAHNRIRTDDLTLTKGVLCQLSYVGRPVSPRMRAAPAARRSGHALPPPRDLVWSPRGDSNPLTYRLQIGCAAVAPLGPEAALRPVGPLWAESLLRPTKIGPASGGFAATVYGCRLRRVKESDAGCRRAVNMTHPDRAVMLSHHDGQHRLDQQGTTARAAIRPVWGARCAGGGPAQAARCARARPPCAVPMPGARVPAPPAPPAIYTSPNRCT